MAPKLDTVAGPTRRYFVKGLRAHGDLADLHDGTYANGGGDTNVILKITRDKDDNDLVWNEVGILGAIKPDGSSTFRHYVPVLIDAFEDKSGRWVSVFEPINEFVSLAEVMTAFPKGVEFENMVWMYKRLLAVIGYAHSKGVIHGAVLPPHFLVHPKTHGGKLIDWSYALNFTELLTANAAAKEECCHGTPGCPGRGDKHWCDPAKVTGKTAAKAAPAATPKKSHNAWEKLLEDAEYDPDPVNVALPAGPPPDPNRKYIRAMAVDWEPYYAPEILVRKTPTPATDIYMAAKCAVAILGGNVETNQLPDAVPVQLKAFLQASLMPATRARPQDAWELLDAFEKLLLQVVGPHKYHTFAMPPKS
jgi:serine/threonine protein kinase